MKLGFFWLIQHHCHHQLSMLRIQATGLLSETRLHSGPPNTFSKRIRLLLEKLIAYLIFGQIPWHNTETRHLSLTTKIFTMLSILFPLAAFLQVGNHTFSHMKVNALNRIPRNGWRLSTQFGIAILDSSSAIWWGIQIFRGTLTMSLYDKLVFQMTEMNLFASTKILCPEIGLGNKRFVHVIVLSYWFHSSVEKDILAGSPDNHGATFAPIILGSDKTTVSVGTGNNEYWPLYGSIGNIHNNIRRAHGLGLVLIGFLAIPHGMYLVVFTVIN